MLARQITTTLPKHCRYFSVQKVLRSTASTQSKQDESYGISRAQTAVGKQSKSTGVDEVLEHRQANSNITTRLHDPKKDEAQIPKPFERSMEEEKY